MMMEARNQGLRGPALRVLPPPHSPGAASRWALGNGPGGPGAHIEAPIAPARPYCELKPTAPIGPARPYCELKPTAPIGPARPYCELGELLPAGPGVEILLAGPRGRLSWATATLRPRLH